jgi:two-component system, sensor histidine kinase
VSTGGNGDDHLAREVAKLRKINEVLMRRVERSMDMQGSDYALFETAILLEAKVRDRTAALEQALKALQQSNRALAEAKAEAERANQSKTRFLAAVSHDLLQPLNAARLFLSALAETGQDDRGRRLIENAEVAFESVERLLASLLDISKLDAGVMAAEPRDVPLGPVFRKLSAEFAPAAERRGLELRAAPTSAVVRTDPDLLLRILRNLLSNAVRYTPRGRVLLGARRRGQGYAVEVGDTGVGVPADKQEEIFEEFRRLGSDADERDRGFGLGLAIVARIARLLGHKVAVRSAPGRGSRFSIEMPAGAAAAAPEAERRAPARAPDRLDGALVVVVENERAIREGMRALLEGWGCEVVTTDTAAKALRALRIARRPPDLIIADYHLDAGELGTDAVARLRAALGGTAPGLVITADRMPEALDRIAAAGLQVLNKPVRPHQLRAVVSHLLGAQGRAAGPG